ncbi:MAG: cytochrome C [Paracoccaceae bacterium]|nr:cytochrome C [Paracoccaceae bacterium]
MKHVLATALALATAGPVTAGGHATGDAATGEKVYSKCRSCHMIVSPDGEVIQRGARTAPNLYGLFGRTPGSVDGFRYGDAFVLLGTMMADGWTEEAFVQYVTDPRTYLRETLNDGAARSRKAYKLGTEQEARDVWAYIVSVSPE